MYPPSWLPTQRTRPRTHPPAHPPSIGEKSTDRGIIHTHIISICISLSLSLCMYVCMHARMYVYDVYDVYHIVHSVSPRILAALLPQEAAKITPGAASGSQQLLDRRSVVVSCCGWRCSRKGYEPAQGSRRYGCRAYRSSMLESIQDAWILNSGTLYSIQMGAGLRYCSPTAGFMGPVLESES